jgi:hypothetical protein
MTETHNYQVSLGRHLPYQISIISKKEKWDKWKSPFMVFCKNATLLETNIGAN